MSTSCSARGRWISRRSSRPCGPSAMRADCTSNSAATATWGPKPRGGLASSWRRWSAEPRPRQAWIAASPKRSVPRGTGRKRRSVMKSIPERILVKRIQNPAVGVLRLVSAHLRSTIAVETHCMSPIPATFGRGFGSTHAIARRVAQRRPRSSIFVEVPLPRTDSRKEELRSRTSRPRCFLSRGGSPECMLYKTKRWSVSGTERVAAFRILGSGWTPSDLQTPTDRRMRRRFQPLSPGSAARSMW